MQYAFLWISDMTYRASLLLMESKLRFAPLEPQSLSKDTLFTTSFCSWDKNTDSRKGKYIVGCPAQLICVSISLSSLKGSVAGRKYFSIIFYRRSMLLHCIACFLITLHITYINLQCWLCQLSNKDANYQSGKIYHLWRQISLLTENYS